MKRFCVLGLIALILAGGCARETGESIPLAGYDFSSIEKVAVLSPTGEIYGAAVKEQVVTFFVQELMAKGYACVERTEIKRIEEEQDFQASGVTTSEGAAQIGKVLNVPVVMLINIPKFESKISLNARLVRVEDGLILWTANGEGRTGKGLNTALGAVVGAAAGAALAGGDTDDRIIGGVAGAAVGGIAGNALSKEQASQVKKIIKEQMFVNLPGRFGG